MTTRFFKSSLLVLLLSGHGTAAALSQTTNASSPVARSTSTSTKTETTDLRAAPPELTRPAAPERTAAVTATEAVKQLLQDAEVLRQRFLEQRAEDLRKLKEATDQDREIIRLKIGDSQAAFLGAQQALREKIQEIRLRTVELKSELKDHREVLDSAREQTRERVRERKPGTD